MVIAAVSVETEKRPPPSPIPKAPAKKIAGECSGSAKTTQEKAAMPTRMPFAPIR